MKVDGDTMSTKEKELQKKFEEECEYASLMRKGNRFAHMRYHYLIALKLCLELRSIYKNEGDEKNYEAWSQVVDAITKNIEIDYDYKEIKEIDAFSIFTKVFMKFAQTKDQAHVLLLTTEMMNVI